jgi:hypothetical protein
VGKRDKDALLVLVLGDAFFMTVVNFVLFLLGTCMREGGSEEHAGLEGKWKNIKDGGRQEDFLLVN